MCKHIMCQRIWMLVFTFFLGIKICSALQVQGYIIKENSDTAYGTIKLDQFHNGYFLLNGFDTESLYYQVAFKSKGDKKFRLYSPASLEGFGFIYEGENYTYSSFLLEHNSIIKGDRERFRFLSLEYSGSINLFQNTVRINYPSGFNRTDQYMVYYEFFLQKDSGKLIKVETTKNVRTVNDLLRQIGVEEKFIEDEVPLKSDFRDIRDILRRYDIWLETIAKRV